MLLLLEIDQGKIYFDKILEWAYVSKHAEET